jgi:hypothetical protein
MAQNKKQVKEVEVKHKRGLEFSCSKQLKLMRGSMLKEQFRVMILNEKASQSRKKQKASKED